METHEFIQAGQLYWEALGRVRIRFHWQDGGDASCWVRVAQRSAGGGMGGQFLPRIGQEVLVQFIENDIDRPLIIGALYNGQGEGGVAPTPAGQSAGAEVAALFAPAADHAPSAQGNLAAGNSPVWHGASAGSDGHNNAAAQWGVRSKEFGVSGYNQLLFDDTDAQGRVQLRSTHAASELNLGHLIHGADNYRGSLRARAPSCAPMPTAPCAVALAGHVGVLKANASALDGKSAPLKAMQAAVSGMVSNASADGAKSGAAVDNTAPGDDKLPHSGAPIIAISARAGLGVTAAQGLQLASGETISLMSGADTQFVTAGQLRLHSGQAIGVLGGVVKPGENGLGVQLIAAKDAVDLQAQADVLAVQARDEVNVVSANAHIDWAAAKSISLSTAGGANITIEGGNITVQCPGKITIHAGKKALMAATGWTIPCR